MAPRVNCTVHGRREYDRRRGGSASRGYAIDWQRMTAIVKQEEPWCRICLREGRYTQTTISDHIIPLAQGGMSVRSNIQGSCGSCNKRKGNKVEGDPGWQKSFAP